MLLDAPSRVALWRSASCVHGKAPYRAPPRLSGKGNETRWVMGQREATTAGPPRLTQSIPHQHRRSRRGHAAFLSSFSSGAAPRRPPAAPCCPCRASAAASACRAPPARPLANPCRTCRRYSCKSRCEQHVLLTVPLAVPCAGVITFWRFVGDLPLAVGRLTIDNACFLNQLRSLLNASASCPVVGSIHFRSKHTPDRTALGARSRPNFGSTLPSPEPRAPWSRLVRFVRSTKHTHVLLRVCVCCEA